VSDRDQIREHLRFFGEIGVAGVSRERAWRSRPGAPPDAVPGRQETERAGPAMAADPLVGTGARELPPDTAPAGPDRSSRAQSRDLAGRETLEDIRLEIGPDCSRCKLHTLGRTQVVFGVGSPTAALMFVGEGPGQDEDLQGIPFVGRAGQLLTRIIEAINLTRDQVYIANVVKCRPPGNRNPEPDEISACEPFLRRQVEAIRPAVIVALGTFAAQALLRTKDPISKLRGRVYRYGDARLVPTFHPAYLLRNPERKRDVWVDMQKVRDMLADLPAGPA
jgi:DNA polymerase